MKCLRCEGWQNHVAENCPHCNYPGNDSRSIFDLIPMGSAKGMLIGLVLMAVLGAVILIAEYVIGKIA